MIYRARWVLPVDRAPIAGGWIETQGSGGTVDVDERITRIGQGQPPAAAEDLGDVALLPGLVNAHTHLELAWMAALVPPSASMDEWIRTLLEVRRAGPKGGRTEVRTAMTRAAREMRATGTVLVGDISNSLVSPSVLLEAGIGGVVFHEILGFKEPESRRGGARCLGASRGAAGRSSVLGRRARAVFGVAGVVQGDRSAHRSERR